MKRLSAVLLALILIVMHASIGLGASADSSAIQMSELFSSRGMEPFDIGITVMKAKAGSSMSGFLDMFPMDAEFGERNEKTASFWELYDTVMSLNLVGATVDAQESPDYALDFVSDGKSEIRIGLYQGLNIADISAKGPNASYTSLGRYVILERNLETKIFDNISTFLASF